MKSNVLNIVLLLPPAPAALVLAGLAFATLSALSAAAFLLIAVAGPPGGLGEEGRAVVEPVVGELTGEEGRGEDCDVVELARPSCVKVSYGRCDVLEKLRRTSATASTFKELLSRSVHSASLPLRELDN